MVVYHLENVSGKYSWKVNRKGPFGVVPAKNFREQRNIWKVSTVFRYGMFQTGTRVPFLQSYLLVSLQFQSFAAVFRYLELELICTHFKRDSGAKFISSEFLLRFTQTVNRPVRPCKWKTAHISQFFQFNLLANNTSSKVTHNYSRRRAWKDIRDIVSTLQPCPHVSILLQRACRSNSIVLFPSSNWRRDYWE